MIAVIFLVFWLFALLIMLCVSVVTVWFFSLSDDYSFFYSTVSGSITSGFSTRLAQWTWVLLTCFGSWKNKTFFLQLCQMVCWVEQHRLASMVFRVWSTLLQDPWPLNFHWKSAVVLMDFPLFVTFPLHLAAFKTVFVVHIYYFGMTTLMARMLEGVNRGIKAMDCGTGEHEGWTTSLPQTEPSVSPVQGGPIAACPSGSACEI